MRLLKAITASIGLTATVILMACSPILLAHCNEQTGPKDTSSMEAREVKTITYTKDSPYWIMFRSYLCS